MVTSNLLGGLGNYMFQITTAYAYSLNNKCDHVFSTNRYLKAHQPLATYLDNILRNINFINENTPNRSTYSEPFFHYKEIPYIENVKLLGYYQSEKYFINRRKEILDLYTIDTKSMSIINSKYSDILKENTCSIHVRRGDYLKLTNHHPTCDLNYYNEAMKRLPKNTKYLVFSDDIDWCRSVFTGDNFTFISNNADYIDLWLMSLCKHNIIANSSFSWWGAWLNKNENKRVIAPKKWFGPAILHNTNDLIPEKWEKI